MGPSFDLIRADEIRVSSAIVASTRTGAPFEPARSWSEVTATEHVIAKEILTPRPASPVVKIVAMRKAVGSPQQRVIRFFPADQIVQEVL